MVRDVLTQPCMWLVAVFCSSAAHRGSVTEGVSRDTSLFPEFVRLLHSMEVPRGCGEPSSGPVLLRSLAGVPGFHMAA